MSTSLPADVVVEILSRLPPKSLLRFRCVSKTWLALIGSHDFFSRNLLNDSILTPQNSSQPLPLILVKATDKSDAEKLVFYSLSYDTLDCVSQIPMNLPPGPVDFLIRPNFYLKLVGSCNGLLCLYNFRSRDVYLWKPTTPSAEFKAIPPLSPHPFSVGFGFDPKSGDFKVVSLRYVADGTETSTLAAEVYSMSRGSWKRLDLRVPYGIFAHSQTLALGGVFLWLAEQNNGQIISFDFSDEVFRTTTLPYTRDALGSYHQLMELNGWYQSSSFLSMAPPNTRRRGNRFAHLEDVYERKEAVGETHTEEQWQRMVDEVEMLQKKLKANQAAIRWQRMVDELELLRKEIEIFTTRVDNRRSPKVRHHRTNQRFVDEDNAVVGHRAYSKKRRARFETEMPRQANLTIIREPQIYQPNPYSMEEERESVDEEFQESEFIDEEFIYEDVEDPSQRFGNWDSPPTYDEEPEEDDSWEEERPTEEHEKDGFFPMFGGLYPEEDGQLEEEGPTDVIANYEEDGIADYEEVEEDLPGALPNFSDEELGYVDFLGVEDILNSPNEDYGEFYADEINYMFTRETMIDPFLSIFMAHGREKERTNSKSAVLPNGVWGFHDNHQSISMMRSVTFILGCCLVVILRNGEWNELTGHPKDRGKDSPNSRANSLQPREDDVD